MPTVTPEQEQKRQDYSSSNPMTQSTTAPSEQSPAQQAQPELAGEALKPEGQTTQQVDEVSGEQAAAPAAAPAQEAAPTTGAAEGGSQPAEAPKEYSFNIGGAQCKITDDLSNASVEFPEKQLWDTVGPQGNASTSVTIPIPGIPVLSLKLGASINWLLQLKPGILSGVTVAKSGSKYSLSGQIDTGVHIGLGVGVSASAGVDLWAVDGGVGLQGTASIGGEAAINTKFEAEYDASTGNIKAAANLATGQLLMPLLAKVSAFIYVDTLFTDTWKVSYPLINANLGQVVVGPAKAGFNYATGAPPDFSLQKPTLSWDSSKANVSFLGR